jgi:hypothetical protein
MNELKRGDKRESDGWLFWQYLIGKREYWVSPEKYAELRQKDCDRFAKKYEQNRDEIKRKAREYYSKNKDSVNERNMEYYRKNLSSVRESMKSYRSRIKELAAKWLEENDANGFIRSLKRGFQREDGMFFWGFQDPHPDGSCRMVWITEREFEEKRAAEIERLRTRYESKKSDTLSRQREYRIKNADAIRERRKLYRAKNAEKIKLAKQKYGIENRDKISKALAKRRAGNPIVRLANSMRRSIRRYLDAGQKGEMSSFEIIGCSKDDLRKHLESKFKDGMTWENYGKHWHIDHIVPLISAKSPEEVKKLCHWTNLQPLTAFENISKGSKMPLAIDASSSQSIDRIIS